MCIEFTVEYGASEVVSNVTCRLPLPQIAPLGIYCMQNILVKTSWGGASKDTW